MSLSTSPDEVILAAELSAPSAVSADSSTQEPGEQGRRHWAPTAVLAAEIAVVAGLFGYGGWQRRWIADDGLIVLRTVRNMLAGNGPVFNMGERVEVSTSTAWTYLIWLVSWVTRARLEYVSLGLALTLSMVAIVFAMLGSARLWRAQGHTPNTATFVLPAGALVYIALPPARDYVTSGLEHALEISWVAVLWWLLIRWSSAPRVRVRGVFGVVVWAGLAPLVRPEESIVAGLALVVVLGAPLPPSRFAAWKLRVLLLVAGGFLPVVYQIFRMGYYGLPVPNTAIAKDASGAKWSQGFHYLWNLLGPYFLWIPLILLLVAGILLAKAGRGEQDSLFAVVRSRSVPRIRAELRTPRAIVAVVVVGASLLTVYALRVGGDFMHGRMLLPQIFLFLLPVSVLPLPRPESGWRLAAPRQMGPVFSVLTVALVGVLVWSAVAVTITGVRVRDRIPTTGIVDERIWFVLATGHDHPIRAEDYLDHPRVRSMIDAIDNSPSGGLLINSPSFTTWFVVPPPEPIPPGGAGHTVYFLNLGMTSMNVPLDVRVLDPMGLAYPLAAHSDRLADGRIGHDKSLYPDWVIADTGMVDRKPWVPYFLDEKWLTRAKAALQCPQTIAMQRSYRAPLGPRLFLSNLVHAVGFASYHIDRVPEYEIERCGLTDPIPKPPS